MECFYNIKTSELVSYPKDLEYSGFEETWQSEVEKVEKNYCDYIRFEGMESHESFEVMKNFIDEIPDKTIRENLNKLFSEENLFSTLSISCMSILSCVSNGLRIKTLVI